MKKVILFFILLISANPIFADPAPKQRKIKFTPTAYYEGMAVDKNPQGQGVLYPCSRCVVTGTFDNNRIRNGKISFSDHNIVITGDFSFAVMGQEQFWVIVNDGIIVRSKTKMPANTPIKFNGENYNFESHYKTFPRMPKSYYELLKQFAGETEYQRASDGRAKRVYNNENSTRVQIQKATYLKVYFVNGVIANYTVADRKNLWTRPNGDFIEFTSTAEGEYMVLKYQITAGKTIITDANITYTFENGNKYVGSVKDTYFNSYISSNTNNLEKLAGFIGVSWVWSEFEEKALNGILYSADGKSENVVNGLTDTRIAQIEAEKEAKRKAEEAARIAAEQEAKRKAEEAARIAAEQEAKRKAEEAARIAAEQEAKRKAEEAARIAAEQEAKRKAEEAARIAAEQEAKRKAEEAARIAAEQEAKRKAEEAARIAAEQEAKRKAEEAARIAAEQEAKHKAEEAVRIAAEQEAKRKAEEAARIAAEEEAKRKAEEAARIAAEQEAKRKAEEAARIAAEQEAKRKAEEAARIAAEQEAKRKAEEVARIAAEQEAKRKAEERARAEAEKEKPLNTLQSEMERIANQEASIAAEKEAKRKAEEARVAAELARASVEKIKGRIISAFEFMVLKKSHTGISQDTQVPRFFYHPTTNPYSPNFRLDFDSRLKNFCPIVGYDIISITGNKVICNLKKRDSDGSVSIYRLEIEHNNGVMNITSLDINKAQRIQ